jgi:hypothetical protein
VAYDDESSNAITTDYQKVRVGGLTWQKCYERYGYAGFEAGGEVITENTVGVCVVTQQSLYLVHIEDSVATVVDHVELALGEMVRATALGDDRLFVSVGTSSYYYGYDYYYGYTSWQDRTLPFIVLSGIRSGTFTAARIELSAGDNWGYVPLVASGTRAALSTGFQGKLAVIDADDPRNPRIAREIELRGYAQDLDIVGDHAVASLGYDGAQAISLTD